MKFLYQPDTALTASDLETLALDLLAEIPIPGVEGWSGLRKSWPLWKRIVLD